MPDKNQTLSEMLDIDPADLNTPERHQYILGSVAPRPIAFASTIDEEGNPNLAPYSFFNAFSSQPPTLVFSSNRRVRDNTTKDTLSNVLATGEVVINVVNHSILYQMALASIEYPASINEFEKSGLTAIPSDLVRPFRVKESPAQFECRVKQVLPLGDEGGAGNLIICEIIRMHFHKSVLDEKGKIDPWKMDLVGRMGRAFYCHPEGDQIFTVFQPVNQIGIGFDGLPFHIRESKVLSGNDLARLASVVNLPSSNPAILQEPEVMNALAGNNQDRENHLHLFAKQLIAKGEIEKAWQVLLAE